MIGAPLRCVSHRQCTVGDPRYLRATAASDGTAAIARFEETIQPILIDYCYRCHADGMKKGDLAFDQASGRATSSGKRDLWWRCSRTCAPGLMPPAGKPRPSEAEVQQLAELDQARRFRDRSANPIRAA